MGRPLLAVQRLAVARGGRSVLSEVSFAADRGDLVLLRGDSGSGKSTLLHVLGGLIPHYDDAEVRGVARLDDVDLATTSLAAVARRATLLMQDADNQFCAHDVESEVAFRLETRGVARAALRRRVDATLARWDLDPLRDRPLARLSGGERRRVLLAALDALEPELLLLDEPLANLDPRWRARVLADLAALRGRTTIVVAEHRVDDLLPLATKTVRLGGPAGSHAVPSVAAPPKRDVPAVSVENVTFGCLRDVTFSARAGLVCVSGPNGAGKTTLARLLAGLERPDGGRVTIGGRDVAEIPARERARLVGYAVQRPGDVLFAPRVRDEVEAAPRALDVSRATAASERSMATWGVAALAERSPFALSGGETQRTALAACLAHDPPIALLDEPTHGLDEGGRRRLEAWLRARSSRGLTFLLTHDPALLALGSRHLVLEEGRLARDEETARPSPRAAPGRGRSAVLEVTA